MTHDHRRRLRALACRASIALCLTATTLAAQPRKPAARPKPPGRPTEAPSAAPSAASTIPVTVVELAGTDAYIKPGANGGVHRGAIVVLGGKEYSVTLTTGAFAVIDVTKSPPHEQDTGTASMVSEEEEKAKELVPPRPLATWSRAWTELAPIANEQTPPFVPLGGNTERNRRWDVRLSTAFGGLFPTGGGANGPSTIRAELNARIHAEPFDGRLTAPITFDFDASLQRWFGPGIDARDGSAARPTIWLREALVGYGSGGWYAGLGRMRYAASTLGTLDGTRVQAPLGQGFAIGAFGGVLPNPLSGEPSLVAQRFGVEATFNRPELALRPEAALVLQGSMFEGSLDERRLSGLVGIYPGLSRFGGHFEVSNFEPGNPWKASPIELTAAGLDGSVRAGIFQLGGRVDVRQPDRSRWLASFLPAYWFCRTVPTAATGTEPCDGSVSTRALGEVDAGVEVGKVSITIGGTRITDLTQTGGAPDMTGAFASGRVVRIAKLVRIEASGNYSQATYLKMYGGSAGPGLTLFDDALDVSAYYRNATLEYRSVSTSLVQNGFGGTVMLFPSPVVIFTLQSEAITGSDANALLVFGTMMWRPRL